MKLKNSTSKSSGTFDKIQSILASHNARKIMFDYGNNGEIVSITFSILINGNECGFKLPARTDNVYKIMFGGLDRYGREKEVTQARKDQAYKTAWANVRDWIDAQMAMIDTEQVKLEQVFLPYMIVSKEGETMFEQLERKQFLLGEGDK